MSGGISRQASLAKSNRAKSNRAGSNRANSNGAVCEQCAGGAACEQGAGGAGRDDREVREVAASRQPRPFSPTRMPGSTGLVATGRNQAGETPSRAIPNPDPAAGGADSSTLLDSRTLTQTGSETRTRQLPGRRCEAAETARPGRGDQDSPKSLRSGEGVQGSSGLSRPPGGVAALVATGSEVGQRAQGSVRESIERSAEAFRTAPAVAPELSQPG